VGIGTARHNATAQGTAIALHIQTACKSIKIPRDEAMPPNLAKLAPCAGHWGNPLIILTLFKNVLEKNLNKIYHDASYVVRGATPRSKRAVSSQQTHRPT